MRALDGPINSQADFAVAWQLRQDQSKQGISQSTRRNPLIVQEAREAASGSLLRAKGASEFSLVGGLIINDGGDKDSQSFNLMTMCERQKQSDILDQASSDIIIHRVSLSTRLTPSLLVIYNMCPDIRSSDLLAATAMPRRLIWPP